ncbi:MAG: glycosyltransferase family 4 protein [Candidatus Omnitrophica bacterium]|nr:glycosyltransferase family 4 protein [Candidatus Omnitrophota bacterium]
MRILMLNYEYPPLGGGGGIFTRDLAEHFACTGHRVDVITTGSKGLKINETVNNVNIYRVPVMGRSSIHVASLISLLSFPIPSMIRGMILMGKTGYDIINTHFAVPTGPTGYLLSKMYNVPNVLTVHGGDISGPGKEYSPDRNFFFRLAVKHVLMTADAVIAQSTALKKFAEDIYAPARSIDIIPLGIRPMEQRTAAGRGEKGTIRLISVGTMKKVKRFDVLLKAFRSASEVSNNIRLTLVGDGPERGYLENLSEELGIKDLVLFTGWLSGDAKYEHLLTSDIFVLPSLHESFGIVLLEAMASGLPIISTDRGGQRDIIKDRENGLLVPPDDQDKLASAISELCADNALRERIAIVNKKTSESYTIQDVARRYLALFQNIISKKTGINIQS